MKPLHFDNDVPRRLATELAASGFDVVRPDVLGLTAASDSEHLRVAFGAGRAMVTHNEKHFATLHVAWIEWRQAWRLPSEHHGVLVIEQYAQRHHTEVAETLVSVLGEGWSFDGAMWRFNVRHGWKSLNGRGRWESNWQESPRP